ncbi:DUF2933 domain-containing protein [Natronohydrobacter thiooxidans]|uniref:DUF2933 domain-containing protein n=1 Tax=Natronohydrobacter thiooxidans TaxID=87172 RepID=UPI0008FF6F0B|nr:DUF2933 domain-containing protein [Natronohydrobacter thiooxidans]
MTDHPKPPQPEGGGIAALVRSRAGWAVCILLAVAGLGLAFEHRVHLAASLPFLLPLAICLVMHVFMHRGHGRGGD